MTQTQANTNSFANKRGLKKESPLGLLIAVIRDDPGKGRDTYAARFRALVLQDDYCDFLDALISEWVSIKFSTASSAACPPSASELRDKAISRREARKTATVMAEKAKGLIGARLLEFMMPNGKALRDCTGAECKQFGGLFAQIGKRVANKRTVGEVLSAEQLARMSKKFTLSEEEK